MSIKNFHIPIILIFIGIALASGFGRYTGVIDFLTFLEPNFTSNGYINFLSFEETFIRNNQWWRLITPMFVHFSFAHLAFNCLWIYVLGSKIELFDGHVKFIILVIFSSLSANYSQYIFSESFLFGGLSGVIYGMFGYCMIIELETSNERYGLPPAIYLFMLVWMILGFLGILTLFGFGNIANYAHLGGLIGGIIFGMVTKWTTVIK